MRDFNQRPTNPTENCPQYLHCIPTLATCAFLGNSFKGNRIFRGFIEDISLRELSLELKDDYFSIQESLLIYSPMELSMDFHFSDGLHQVVLTGIITWKKRVRKKENSYLYLKIRLDEQDEKSREVLKDYLSLGIGDTNLIWNLWDNLSLRA
jgi:hypothetical protein